MSSSSDGGLHNSIGVMELKLTPGAEKLIDKLTLKRTDAQKKRKSLKSLNRNSLKHMNNKVFITGQNQKVRSIPEVIDHCMKRDYKGLNAEDIETLKPTFVPQGWIPNNPRVLEPELKTRIEELFHKREDFNGLIQKLENVIQHYNGTFANDPIVIQLDRKLKTLTNKKALLALEEYLHKKGEKVTTEDKQQLEEIIERQETLREISQELESVISSGNVDCKGHKEKPFKVQLDQSVGEMAEHQAYSALRDYFEEIRERVFVIRGVQMIQINDEKRIKEGHREFDFIIVNFDHQYVMNIEVKNFLGTVHSPSFKVSSVDKAKEQIQACKNYLEEWFGADLSKDWRFIGTIFTLKTEEGLTSCCENCEDFIIEGKVYYRKNRLNKKSNNF